MKLNSDSHPRTKICWEGVKIGDAACESFGAPCGLPQSSGQKQVTLH